MLENICNCLVFKLYFQAKGFVFKAQKAKATRRSLVIKYVVVVLPSCLSYPNVIPGIQSNPFLSNKIEVLLLTDCMLSCNILKT